MRWEKNDGCLLKTGPSEKPIQNIELMQRLSLDSVPKTKWVKVGNIEVMKTHL